MHSRIKILLAGIAITAVSLLVIYKAVIMPATYDEVTTISDYVGISKIPDAVFNAGNNPNNHILNSLSVTLCQSIFGNHAWSMRLPNILAFFVFCACVTIMARQFFNSSILSFCLPFVCLLFNPYLIDFFSLARGYGMANAFMSCSILSLLFFATTRETDTKNYYRTIFFAALAAYANFSFLMFWIAIHVLLLSNLIIKNISIQEKKAILLKTFIAGAGFLALCIIPVYSIQDSIRSAPGIYKSFYHQTFIGEIDRYMYGKPLGGIAVIPLSQIVIGLLFIAAFNFLLKIKKNISSAVTDPFNLVFLLLTFIVIINFFQVYWSDTDYPTYRSALIYYVLYSFVLIFLIRDMALSGVFSIQICQGLILVFFTWHFIEAVNLKSVYEWSYDAYTNDVMDYIKDYRKNHPNGGKIKLYLTNSFRNSFDYYTESNSVDWLEIIPPQMMHYFIIEWIPQCKASFIIQRTVIFRTSKTIYP